ncbi:MAG: hypothetical protein ABEI06_00955 [Halobacteriaceae archaeon]
MDILPIEEAEVPVGWIDQRTLNYPVGIAKIEELVEKQFDLDAFREVNQFLYPGKDDDNDTLIYPDAWARPKVRATAVVVDGEKIHQNRLPSCIQVYGRVNTMAVLWEYKNTCPEPTSVLTDIAEFHRRSIKEENIDVIRSDLRAQL